MSSELVFLTGGTIVATPNATQKGVGNNKKEWIDLENKLGLKVKLSSCFKLSELYTNHDYYVIFEELSELSKRYSRIYVSHGTDFTPYFASWLHYLAIKLDLRIFLLAGQKSYDKPNCQLPLLIDVARKVKLNKPGALFVCWKDYPEIYLMNPLTITKISSTNRESFKSFFYEVVKNTKTGLIYIKRKNNYQIKFQKQTLNLLRNLTIAKQVHPVNLILDNPFLTDLPNNNSELTLVVSPGLANFTKKMEKPYFLVSSSEGLLTKDIYNTRTDKAITLNWTWFAALTLLTLTNLGQYFLC